MAVELGADERGGAEWEVEPNEQTGEAAEDTKHNRFPLQEDARPGDDDEEGAGGDGENGEGVVGDTDADGEAAGI